MERLAVGVAGLDAEWLDARDGRRETLERAGLIKAQGKGKGKAGLIGAQGKKTVWLDDADALRSYKTASPASHNQPKQRRSRGSTTYPPTLPTTTTTHRFPPPHLPNRPRAQNTTDTSHRAPVPLCAAGPAPAGRREAQPRPALMTHKGGRSQVVQKKKDGLVDAVSRGKVTKNGWRWGIPMTRMRTGRRVRGRGRCTSLVGRGSASCVMVIQSKFWTACEREIQERSDIFPAVFTLDILTKPSHFLKPLSQKSKPSPCPSWNRRLRPSPPLSPAAYTCALHRLLLAPRVHALCLPLIPPLQIHNRQRDHRHKHAEREHADPALCVPGRIGRSPEGEVPPTVHDVAENVHAGQHHRPFLLVLCADDVGPGKVGRLTHVPRSLDGKGEELGAVGNVPHQQHHRAYADDDAHQRVDPPSTAEIVGRVRRDDGGEDGDTDEAERIVVDLCLAET